MIKETIFFLTAAVFGLHLLNVPAFAAEFTVSPLADSDCSDLICDLNSALSEAAVNNQDDTIFLENGVYDLSTLGSTIVYNPTVTEVFSLNLVGSGNGLTIIDGTGVATGEAMAEIALLPTTTLNLSRVSFQNSSGIGLRVTSSQASISVDQCQFINNAGGLSIPNNSGGAISITHTSFFGNSISGSSLEADSIVLANSIFYENIGRAAVLNNFEGAAEIKVVYNSIVANRADSADSVTSGLSIFLDGDTSEARVTNNIVRNNLSISGGSLADIFFNGGIDFSGDGKGNSIHLINNNFSKFESRCFEGCSIPKEESGNINKDPLFVDPENGDFHLSPSSPCVNTGTADVALVDLPEFDLDGNPRIFGPAPDMGAYELQEEPSPNDSGSSGGCSLIP